MNKVCLKRLVSCIIFFSALSANAKIPTRCLSESQLQAVNFSHIDVYNDNGEPGHLAFTVSHYHTSFKWKFMRFVPMKKAKMSDVALDYARKTTFPVMGMDDTPKKYKGIYSCLYLTAAGDYALATTSG